MQMNSVPIISTPDFIIAMVLTLIVLGAVTFMVIFLVKIYRKLTELSRAIEQYNERQDPPTS